MKFLSPWGAVRVLESAPMISLFYVSVSSCCFFDVRQAEKTCKQNGKIIMLLNNFITITIQQNKILFDLKIRMDT